MVLWQNHVYGHLIIRQRQVIALRVWSGVKTGNAILILTENIDEHRFVLQFLGPFGSPGSRGQAGMFVNFLIKLPHHSKRNVCRSVVHGMVHGMLYGPADPEVV